MKAFQDKVLLITGGTGSFGNAVLERYLGSGLREIRIFSRDEKKQDDMRRIYADERIKYYIGDVRDYDSVAGAMEGVDYVFHAAALKQVPSCEFYPMEAVKTNIAGADNVLEAAIQKKVSRVIVLSTDKAVYPINAMGMSKALMEKLVAAKSRNVTNDQTILCCTRYGNVMASRGSVIPLFIEQIEAGNALTVTDPAMTRFLLHLDEAVDLVMFAFTNGRQGDLFVRKAPACTIQVLAEALTQLLGRKTDVRVIGTRHGEKLYETLVSREEMVRAESLDGYFRVPADSRDLNYSKYFVDGEESISTREDYTSHNTRRLTLSETKDVLLRLDCVRERMQGGNA